ncbi:MAG: efflux RND transporter permease subunit [Desulfobacterales bacterium]|nr:efflux RND transporter permease subunit [Desulfobacterales bacterium]MCP4162612.1 efflux RND transporter permease subunit [Deltaproteobacteria bacterium]
MIRFFGGHPTAANLMMLVLVIIGIISLPTLKRETFPEFSADMIQVSVIYPGATAEDIEESICKRIEDAVDMVNYVQEVRSEAKEGIGIVTIEMEEGRNFQTFINDIKTEVEAISDFPDEADVPIIREIGTTDPVVSIAVTGPMSLPDLKAYCEDLKKRLGRENGVSMVKISGFSDHQIRITIPTQTLMQYGLSLDQIVGVIKSQSVSLPGGAIEALDQEVTIRFVDERKSPESFQDLIVVSSSSGAEIKLGEIAEIHDLFELTEEKYLFDGKRAGLIQISKTKSQDALNVLAAAKMFFEKENQRKPPNVKFSFTQDATSVVKDRLQMLFTNGWQGLLLVFFTLWLFFNFKLSFWVAMGLPVSFMGAFFFLSYIGYSINMLSMVGLLLVLGLMMDDAIVIAENVATHLAKGKSALRAAVEGTIEVKNGVMSSFLTTLCIFGPLTYITGSIGKVLKVVPVVMLIVLAVSIVEAFCILPNHLSHSLKDYDPDSRNSLRKWFDEKIEWIREDVVGKLTDKAVKFRYFTLTIVISSFIFSIGMMPSGILKFKAFPAIDGDIIEAKILLPQGTPLKKTEMFVEKMLIALGEVNKEFKPNQPDNKNLVTHTAVYYNKNTAAHEVGSHVATLTVDLLSAEVRKAKIDDILNLWRTKIGVLPDVLQLKFGEPSFGPAGNPLEIRLRADNLNELMEASYEVQSWLKNLRGVSDISDDLRPGKPEIQIKMKEGAASLGLNALTIASQLRSAFYGKTASTIQVGSESYEIDVKLPQVDQNSLADLDYFHVTLPDGKQVPLSAVATLKSGRGYARIAVVDGQRTVTVTGDVDTEVANVAEIVALFSKEFLPQFLKKYPNIRVTQEGESKEGAKTGKSLIRGFIIGLIGVFILLSFQFRSYVEPLVVMIAIPLGMIGVVWGHLLMGLDLSMPSLLGFASLAGVVVNDSILLVEFIKLRRNEGVSVSIASVMAGRDRFRAVMLTSLTTITGLIPLLMEKSLQAQILIPLATSIVFGLMASTCLVLVVIPALYSILGDLGLATKVDIEQEL